MKKIFAVLIMGIIVLSCTAAFADEPEAAADVETATVIVNGKTMEFDTPAIIIEGRTMVPMRAIFEELGAEVEWIEENQLIFASKGPRLVTMKIGKKNISIGDLSTELITSVDLDVAPFLNETGDRTLVPLRAVSEAFGAEVLWDETTSTVTITL